MPPPASDLSWMTAEWRFVACALGSADMEIEMPNGTLVFAGTADDAMEVARTLAVPSGRQLLVTTNRPSPLIDDTAWRDREIRERADGRGWDLLQSAHDHGGWHTSARQASSYVLQREHRGHVLAIRIFNRAGQLRQIILHDEREIAATSI